MDVVAFQVVTVGQKATERFDKLQNAGDYSEAYFTHGLAVQTAEATADYLHQHIRREMGIVVERRFLRSIRIVMRRDGQGITAKARARRSVSF